MSCPPHIVVRSGSDPAPNTGGGTPGQQGPRGYQGYQGFQGACCPGPQGVPGIGTQGFQGVPGLGYQGYQGARGAPGQNGFDGEQGPQGIQGVMGVQGYQGLGSQGPQGAGFQGEPGGPGVQGPQGTPGVIGVDGQPGPQGYQGNMGFQGSGGQDLYNNSTPTSVTLGGISSGSTFVNRTMQQMWDSLLYPYQAPAFTAFSISGQSTTVEVGTTISGTKTFTWSTSNSSNVQANSITIRDVTNATNLATGLANDGSEALSVGTVQKTSATSHQWSITGTNTQSGNFSASFTVSWVWRLYYGTSTNTTLTEPQIEALANSLLTSTAARTYSYPGGGYKYLAFPTTFTAPSSFKDASNNLNVAMADSSDAASYSNTANGLSFAIVSVTNSLGQTVNYRVYRTKNILGGSINIVVA